ncbi:MAG: hypothetical protein K6U78_01145 [Anaerolineae bacterium]|nr:hypothetical protein [Anaerolineae bacterium]
MPSLSLRVRRSEWIAFALVMALATALRLYRLDLIDVRFDEASAPQLAMGIVRGDWLPVAPFSGSVANHPPTYLYLLALPYLFTRDFMAIAAYRALLDVAAIAACWWLCRRFFGHSPGIAFVACLLFAAAPWAIQFARRTWLAPVPLFQVVLLFGLLEAMVRRNPWGWAIVGWGLALSAGAHLAAIYLVPVVLLALFIGRATLRPLPCLVGLLPLLVLTGVYLGFDAGQDFRNVRALLGAAGGAASWSADALRFASWASGGAHLSDLTGGAYPIWRAQAWAAFGWIDALQMALLVASAGLLVIQLVHRPALYAAPGIVVLLAWLALPVALQLRPLRPLQMHYFVALYPVPFIVMALGLDVAVRALRAPALRGVAGWVSAFVVALVVGWQVFTTLRFTEFIQRHDTSYGGYGPPVRSALDAAGLARDAVRAGVARDVIVVTTGGDPRVNGPATVMDVLLADLPHRFADANAGLILREDVAQYIITPDALAALDLLLQHADAEAVVHEIPLQVGREEAYVYVRINLARLPAVRAWPAQWENGVGLLGYRAGQGNPLVMDYYLRVFREAEPGMDYHWFNHLYDGDRKFAALDGGGIHPANWRAGDVLLHRFAIPLPDDAPARPYRLHMGAYRYPQLQNIAVLDAQGRPTTDHVTLNIE